MKTMNTISWKMLNALQRAARRLDPVAVEAMRSYLRTQQSDMGGFINKGGKSDVYYTSFGMSLCYALKAQADINVLRGYLSQIDAGQLDLVHYAARMRCDLLLTLMEKGTVRGMATWLTASHQLPAYSSFGQYPNDDAHSPYSLFIWYSLLEDARQGKQGWTQQLADDLQPYHAQGGGFCNRRSGQLMSTNATAAAIMIGLQERMDVQADVQALQDMQEECGGFKAQADALMPDLLSTATALFVLHCAGAKLRYAADEFIQAHWLDDKGSFSATIADEQTDVEYLFYGLLAIGSLYE